MQPVLTAGFFGLGGQEVVLVAIVAVILFGGKKIGDLGKGLGEGIRNFKDAMNEGKAEKKEETTVEAKK